MKLNKKYKEVMKTAFDCYNKLVVIEQNDYLDKLFQTMTEKGNLISFDRGESDFRDFAIKGYLHNLKNKHDEWLEILNAVSCARNIADGFTDDLEDCEPV